MNWKRKIELVLLLILLIVPLFACGYIEFNYSHLWWGDPLTVFVMMIWTCAVLRSFYLFVIISDED